MDVEKVFHMKGGVGNTSYSQNSAIQRRAAEMVKHITVEAIKGMFLKIKPKSLGIADMGCASGPNTLSNTKRLVDAVEEASRDALEPVPELQVYLNDLPTNDFNTIFQMLPDFYRELKKGQGGPSIYIAGFPGTFYGRVFPAKCLHFVYSAHSLHWLSRVPPGIYDEQKLSINKKSIYISERSPSGVSEAYVKQFHDDFSLFLKSRSEELLGGGRMVLIMSGRNGRPHVDRGISFLWELLYQSLAVLVSQGEVEEEKLETYQVHFYAPWKEELEEEVKKEGSFKIETIEKFQTENNAGNCSSYGMAVAKTVRSVQEPMIAHHFGVGEETLDKLFQLYGELVDQELAKGDIMSIIMVLVLTKL